MTRRWWAFPWDTARDEEFMARDCARKITEIKSAMDQSRASDPEYAVAVAFLHRHKYVAEIVLNEIDVAVCESEVERVLALAEPPVDRLERKVYNLGRAVDFLFPLHLSVMRHRPPERHLNVEAIQEVHRIALVGLMPDAGQFRRCEAAPSGYCMYYYKSPDKIEASLAKLCKDTVARLQGSPDDSPEYITQLASIAGDFLGTFLDIHPFSNGNGRVGRLLLSYILNSVCIVPVSLNIRATKPSRELYLAILEQARLGGTHDYSTLHSLVLEAIHRNVSQLHWWQTPG
jgi:Fic family protein